MKDALGMVLSIFFLPVLLRLGIRWDLGVLAWVRPWSSSS